MSDTFLKLLRRRLREMRAKHPETAALFTPGEPIQQSLHTLIGSALLMTEPAEGQDLFIRHVPTSGGVLTVVPLEDVERFAKVDGAICFVGYYVPALAPGQTHHA